MLAFPAPGSRLGPYRVVRELGRGGMGVVYEAVEDALARRVALKVISPGLAGTPGFRERFTREAQAHASLESPHVVAVYAHGEVDGRLYLATQLVPGGDLGSWLREHGTPPPQVAVELISQVAAGLADAHANGLVHRDIKPANVLLRFGRTGVTAYLTDFGIAHRVGARTRPSAPGAVPGTPGYLAPELSDGGAPSPASDVYALGCLLRVTLGGTGRWPRALEPVLRSALAEDPADRYRTAAELHDALRDVQGRTTSRHRRNRLVVGAVGVVACLSVVGCAGFLLTSDDEPRDAGARADRPVFTERQVAGEIASALTAHGAVGRADATCVARRLLRKGGVGGLVEAGLLDADHHVVATSSDDLDRAVLADVFSAGLSCILGPPVRGAR